MAFACLSSGVHVRIKYGCSILSLKMAGEVYQAIIEKLRVNYFAKIVILFLRSHVVDPVTTTFNDQMHYGEFMFIGSEAWGYKPDQFQAKKKLIGSITLALQMAKNDNFTSYLSNLDIFTNTQDPWIKTYAEKKFDCYFSYYDIISMYSVPENILRR
jgi:hypothetical protein